MTLVYRSMTARGKEHSVTQVAMYVDGFNLYNGLREKHGRKYLWLDLEGVARRLLRPGQQLSTVRYFTASVRNHPSGQARQATYLNALQAATSVDVVLGRFQEKTRHCFRCGRSWRTYEEKETDVSIAVSLLEDGINDLFDTALILSADSDLCPAINALRRLKPDKRVIAVFPPKRRSDELRRVASASFTLGDAIIRQSQLPRDVPGDSGSHYRRPEKWR